MICNSVAGSGEVMCTSTDPEMANKISCDTAKMLRDFPAIFGENTPAATTVVTTAGEAMKKNNIGGESGRFLGRLAGRAGSYF